MRKLKKTLKAGLCVCLAALMCTGLPLTAFADAGPDPGTVDDSDKKFPDPDSFSYDDVEVNFAKGLQYSLHFYDANKCGSGITGGRLEWRADCHTEDGMIPLKQYGEDYIGVNVSDEFIAEHIDILDPDGDGHLDCDGGMHDAGDHVKFGLPGSYAATTVAWGYYEFREAYEKSGNAEHAEDIIHWFLDFYLKATYYDEDGSILAFVYQVGEGNIDHNYWICPELQNTKALKDFARPAYLATVDTPASDMCAGTAASLAIGYLIFKDSEPEYAAECLKAAYALYDFAVETHEENEGGDVLSLGYDGGFYDSSYDYDELSLAAVWLYLCTIDQDPSMKDEAYDKYINAIISVDETKVLDNGAHPYTGYMKRIIKDTGNCWQNIWVHCWDTVWGGVFAKLAPVTNIERDWYIFRWNLEYWSGLPHIDPGLDDEIWNKPYVPDTQAVEPQETTYLAKTPAGFSMLNEYGSARYNTAAQLCALVYAKYSPEKELDPMRFAEWAKSQMEYIMGRNPMNRPYIVGWSETAASHPHHRASHGSTDFNMDHPETQTHVLWGALVGGPDSGDWHRDITKDYVYNEVAVDYNAGFVGACAGLYYYYGTEDMKNQENFPPKEVDMKGDIVEFTLKAAVGQEDKMASQILLELNSHTMLPPRYLNEIKIRYYFDIAEMLAEGHSIDDLTVRIDYDTMKSNTDGEYEVSYEVVQYTDDGKCYIEFTWPDYQFVGMLQFQFALMDAEPTEDFEFCWDPTNDYSRSEMVTCDELGVPLNEAPQYYDLCTMAVDGVKVWGTAPEGAPDFDTNGTIPTVPDEKVNYGDVNCDGTVDISDVILLARNTAEDNTAVISETGKKNADCNMNGKLENGDTTQILKFIAKLISKPNAVNE